MTPIYDRSVRELIQDAVGEMPDPFTARDMTQWFREHYEKVNPNTVRAHLRDACVNVPRDPTHPKWRHDQLTAYRLRPGVFTRYLPEVHGEFEGGLPVGITEETEDADPIDSADSGADAAFVLEEHLEDFMEENWSSIDFGRPLQIWGDADDEWGRQYSTEVGVIDFLCEDRATNELVVVELKRGRSSDRVVGQILRYMGWVREKLADGRGVSGIIITHDYDDRVRYAVAELPSVEAWTYQVSFTLDTKAFAI